MKLRHTIYNSIGLGVAGICALLWLGKVLLLMRMNSLPNRHPVDFIVSFILLLMTVVLVGGGGVANLTSGRLQPRATTVMVIAYFLTIIFIPLGIWGVIELQSCREARRRYRGGNHGTPDSAIFSRPLLRWMATASWAGPAGGFVLAVLCASTHHRPLVLVAALTFLLVVMASLVLGAVALVLAISRQDKQGILVPAIIGISVSALIILLLLIAVVAGVFKFRQKHRAATPSVAAVGGAHPPDCHLPGGGAIPLLR